MHLAHHHKNTTYGEHKTGNYTDFNFVMNCKSEKHINSDGDGIQRCSSSPTNFNTPEDGQVG
jgi:hypothetical protein